MWPRKGYKYCAGSHPGTTHVRFKCIPKLGIVFGENCHFYGNLEGLCNNKRSRCCTVPVRMDNM
ncbi:beta-defensin 50-like [Acomys russatus]|uniref:beta-defensin 50-like n=1 Tax=Acomys russatus TaxID=60746 RepID=UPI0021E1EE9D|nr:beta-defensin 50-like [Acomys russatus]